jgi:hypothetical protein
MDHSNEDVLFLIIITKSVIFYLIKDKYLIESYVLLNSISFDAFE